MLAIKQKKAIKNKIPFDRKHIYLVMHQCLSKKHTQRDQQWTLVITYAWSFLVIGNF